MLCFQTLSLILTLFPPALEFVIMAIHWAYRRLFPSDADKFVAVVEQVMCTNERILSMKFADRWLLK